MQTFPASSSILAASPLAEFLKEQYHLPADTNCCLIKAGINHTYRVNSNTTQYIFRVYSFNWRTKKEIAEELRLLKHLKDNHVPVSFAIADANRNYIQELQAVEGTRFAVLFSYAGGEKMLEFSNETHSRIGEIMALIHKKTEHFLLERISYTPETLLLHSFEHIKAYLSPEKAEMVFMKDTQQYLLEALKNADASKIRKGAVHIDIWFDNLNIKTNNEITLFDFDFCGNGWLCLDIAYYLMQLYFLEPDENEFFKKVAYFFKGYESIVPVSSEEKRLLPMLGVCLYFFYLGVQCSRFENWSNVFINEVYLKRYITIRVKKYFDFGNRLPDSFTQHMQAL